jgi:catalytic LigB subunit of aromatic ring-opening dioxygenase
MAEVVFAAGTSHTPMLCMQAVDWPEYALGDHRNGGLLDIDGQRRSFEDLAANRGDRLRPELTSDIFAARWQAAQLALDRLAASIARVAPDVSVIIGDDQDELFGPDMQPAVAIYWGEQLLTGAREARQAVLVGRAEDSRSRWQHDVAVAQAIDSVHEYDVASGLAKDLLSDLVCRGFDITSMRSMPPTRKFGHAFGFVIRRLLQDGQIPVIPVVVNTFYSPNQPSPVRCYALGQALRSAIEQHPSGARVAIIASGGLSHFVVDEPLDRAVLAAIEDNDADALCAIPVARLNSGTSEIRNWVTVAAASEHLPVAWSTYEPAYRTPAGTGCGLAFLERSDAGKPGEIFDDRN